MQTAQLLTVVRRLDRSPGDIFTQDVLAIFFERSSTVTDCRLLPVSWTGQEVEVVINFIRQHGADGL
jgi:hypothetical protein